MAKNIVLFSDGTGNSAAKLNKTNVWRVYQALDLSMPSSLPQVALYDDGVGTSGFRPLALLGGAFGYGLKRNVLDLYKFLCRNYQPGDRIYAFGFSRGAFTIHVLMSFVLRIGLIKYEGEAHLSRHAEDAYRQRWVPRRWCRQRARCGRPRTRTLSCRQACGIGAVPATE